MQSRSKTRVAVAGLGSIGAEVVNELDRGIEGLVLTAVASQNPDKHRSWLAELKAPPQVLPIEQLTDAADIVVHAASFFAGKGLLRDRTKAPMINAS